MKQAALNFGAQLGLAPGVPPTRDAISELCHVARKIEKKKTQVCRDCLSAHQLKLLGIAVFSLPAQIRPHYLNATHTRSGDLNKSVPLLSRSTPWQKAAEQGLSLMVSRQKARKDQKLAGRCNREMADTTSADAKQTFRWRLRKGIAFTDVCFVAALHARFWNGTIFSQPRLEGSAADAATLLVRSSPLEREAIC